MFIIRGDTVFSKEFIARKTKGNLFIHYSLQAKNPIGNILFCCTPIFSVSEPEIQQCYSAFTGYGYNVFAFDFYGTCNSNEPGSKISNQSIIEDFETLSTYIQTINSQPIFLFADTGTGGILGQLYAQSPNNLKAFAQYGQLTYKDLSFMLDIPPLFYPIIYYFLTALSVLFPNLKIKLSIPKFNGYNAEKENLYYQSLLNKNPNCFKVSIHLLQTLFWFCLSKNSPISTPASLPTLVFNAQYDRYFSNEYVSHYYKALRGKKNSKQSQIVTIHTFSILNWLQRKSLPGSKKTLLLNNLHNYSL